ncbi:MAG: CBS domain-containing protein [Candidatus Eisenbacteria sp.]|nr:CBS domain-containing protein [Candidatus Eisenbacteria bacterium]
MSTVRELLEAKGREAWSISPRSLVFEALQMMAEKDVGALLVLEEGQVVGVFSERDYARKVVLEGKSSKTVPVSDLMTKRIIFVGPEETIDTCMKLMTAKRIRHLPVLDDGRLIGLVSVGDVVKRIISDQEFTIQELEKYITGSGYGA